MSIYANCEHRGAEWIRTSLKCELSPLGAAVADLLGDLYAGIYHINHTSLGKVDWSNEHYIRVTVSLHDMHSYDCDRLTRLIFLAHDFALRVELQSAGFGYLRLFFTQRSHAGQNSYYRHPTLEQAVAAFRKGHQPKKEEAAQ